MFFGGNSPLSFRDLAQQQAAGSDLLLRKLAKIVRGYIRCFCAAEDITSWRLNDHNVLNQPADATLAKRLLAFERGAQLVYGADGSTHHLQFDFSAYPEAPTTTPPGDQTVLRVHHENGYTLDLRTGIIVENPDTSLWTFINPLLPTAQEFLDL